MGAVRYNEVEKTGRSGRILAWFTAMLVGVTCAVNSSAQQTSTPRHERIGQLLNIIRDKSIKENDPNRFRGAIQELGKLRATEAVDDLIDLLTYRREWQRERAPYDYTTDGSSWRNFVGAEYPASEALENIGKPALPTLVKVIEGHDDASLESKNARYTVRAILKHERRDPEAFFKDEAARAPSREAARRLLKALETADKDWRVE